MNKKPLLQWLGPYQQAASSLTLSRSHYCFIQPEDDDKGYGNRITLKSTLYSSHINQGAGLDAPPCNSRLRPCQCKVWPRGEGT